MTSTSRITITEPQTPEEFEAYYDLRWRVLREPWNQPRGSERDEFDDGSATHFMACIGDDRTPVGVARIHFVSKTEAQGRYMAVEEAHRGKKIARLLLEHMEQFARERGAQVAVGNARVSALDVYLRLGYEVVGDADTMFGTVEHKRIRKELRVPERC